MNTECAAPTFPRAALPAWNTVKHTGPALAGVTAMLIWASMPTLIKFGTDGLDLYQFVVLRFGLPLVCVIPFARSVLAKVRGTTWRRWALLAVAMQAHVVLQVYALMHALPASWFGLAFALGVPLTVVALKPALGAGRVITLGATLVGIVVFTACQDLGTFPTPGVIIAILGSVAAWVVLTVQMVDLQKRLRDPEVLALFILLMAPSVVGMAPLAAWHWPPPTAGAAIIGLAAGVALGLVLFSLCLRHLPVFGVSIQYVEPILAALIGTAFRGEPALAVGQWFAIAIVINALIVLNRLETTHHHEAQA